MENYSIKLFSLKNLIIILVVVLLTNLISEAMAEISFEDTTDDSKIYIRTQTYGAAWGDFNGDEWPDLWSGNHFKHPKLYLNNKDGTFTDISLPLGLDSFTGEDLHGPSWIDFDNDGDQDLFILAGAESGKGTGPNLLFVNKNNSLQDYAVEYGLDFPFARARAPIWFDWDNDGLLDVIMSNLHRPDEKAPTSFFHQTSTGFENLTPDDGFKVNSRHGTFQVHAPNNMTHVFYVTLYNEGIYNLSNFPNQTLRDPLSLKNPQSVDLAIEDFNGDLLFDIFQTKSDILSSYVFLEDPKNVFARLFLANAGEQNLKIISNGTLNFHFITLTRDRFNITDIYIGSDGFHPELASMGGLKINPAGGVSFSVSPNDSKVWGILDHNPGVDTGIYIGYDHNNKFWNIQHSSAVRSKAQFIVNSTTPILDIIKNETEFNTVFINDQLLIQTNSGFEDLTTFNGFETPTSCGSIGTGDFDNDMDIDIYLVCSLSTRNLPNILYENIGNGMFVAVDNAGGATGTNLGIGGTVSIADYDRDGFLDLFVTNGAHSRAFKIIGPSQLFKNMGNENHWLEIDLEGTISNRDGIGARVYVTANDVTQIREQSGGIHYRSQDFQRIHFGLGQNELVESLIVHWPSGIVQELNNIATDQIIRIVEEIPIESIKNQISKGINPEDIKCKNNLTLMIKHSKNTPACVKFTTVHKLVERNWGYELPLV